MIDWIKADERDPLPNRNEPYISCIVYSCNPETPIGGTVQMCRWDRKNKEWLKSDIRANWFLHEPYLITHFCDKYNKPNFN